MKSFQSWCATAFALFLNHDESLQWLVPQAHALPNKLSRHSSVFQVCMHPVHVCDGIAQCPHEDDEHACDLTCPTSCNCQGHAFVCSSKFNTHYYSELRYFYASC